MNIGIDIDDTLSNSFETIFADSQKFDIEVVGNDGKVNNYGKISNHYYIENMYTWKEEQYEEFWTTYFIKALIEATPKMYAKQVVQKLKQEGNHIYIITSRYEDELYKNVEKETKNWLEKHGIIYDKLILNAQDKAKVAKEYKIDIFIDDSMAHCKKIQAQGIKAFWYTSVMNQGIEDDELTRVYSWSQIYHLIHQLFD